MGSNKALLPELMDGTLYRRDLDATELCCCSQCSTCVCIASRVLLQVSCRETLHCHLLLMLQIESGLLWLGCGLYAVTLGVHPLNSMNTSSASLVYISSATKMAADRSAVVPRMECDMSAVV